MKKLIFRLTLPLTLISFGIITKWSYGIVIDGTDEFLYGFPLIYKCDGFHTSLSTQYFLTEMTINLLTYFAFWLIITLILNLIWKINISKRISKIFWIGYAILFLGFIYLSNDFDEVMGSFTHIDSCGNVWTVDYWGYSFFEVTQILFALDDLLCMLG